LEDILVVATFGIEVLSIFILTGKIIIQPMPGNKLLFSIPFDLSGGAVSVGVGMAGSIYLHSEGLIKKSGGDGFVPFLRAVGALVILAYRPASEAMAKSETYGFLFSLLSGQIGILIRTFI
jgi:hypothetical protein